MTKDKRPPKKGSAMATKPVRHESAEEAFLEGIDDLIDSAANEMTDRQFAKAEKQFNAVVDRAVASRSRNRETA